MIPKMKNKLKMNKRNYIKTSLELKDITVPNNKK